MLQRGKFVLLVAVAALAAACTSEAAPATPSPTSSTKSAAPVAKTTPKRTVDPDHLRAKDALGDFTTVDPCSMVTLLDMPAEYTKGGGAYVLTPTNLDTCSISLPVATDKFIDVDWGVLETHSSLSDREDLKKSKSLGHGVSLLVATDKADQCLQYLLFADDLTMEVATYADGKMVKPCDVGTKIAGMIVKTLLAKAPSHRTVREQSLLHQDACDLLTPAIVGLLPGAAGARKDRDYPTHHWCHYLGPHTEFVSLVFAAVSGDDAPLDGQTTVKIAGKPTYQYTSADGVECMLTTEYEAAGKTGHSSEAVQLIVVADDVPSLCKKASKLADKIWRKLPAA